MKILVTGGSGFIGTNLTEALVAAGHSVRSIDIRSPRNLAQREIWENVDVTDMSSVNRVLADFSPEAVVHLAARTDLDGTTLADYSVNYEGVVCLAKALQAQCPSARRIYVSSRLVCKIGYQPKDDQDFCPSTPYGESKVESELAVRRIERDSNWIIVRPTSIWGPWFGAPYNTFFKSVLAGTYVHPRGVHLPKSFGFVGNAAFQLERMLDTRIALIRGKVLYLADYSPIEVGEFADMIRKAAGMGPSLRVPLTVLRGLAAAGDFVRWMGWKHPPLTSFRLENLLTPMVHDLSPTNAVVGPLPYSLQEGIDATLKWLNSRGPTAE